MPVEYRPSVIGKCFVIGDIKKAQVCVKSDVTLLLLLRMLQQATPLM